MKTGKIEEGEKILPDGTIHGLFAAARDITTRKRAEEAILTAQRKLRILSGVTRHDIKNRLMVLKGYLDHIREGGRSPEACRLSA